MIDTDTRPHNYARYVAGCRCRTCQRANVAYENNRRRQVAYGRWQPFVDAEPVRQHIQRLRAAGMGQKRIAELACVSTNTIAKLLYGPTPTRRVRPWTAEKLLAITLSVDLLRAAALVDATGARRRLQALVAIGWPMMELARRMDMAPSTFSQFMRSRTVRAINSRRVWELYESMWNQPPPQDTPRQRGVSSLACALARAEGWLPPLAWDDDTIDDPAAGAPEPLEQVDVDDVVVDLCLAGEPTGRPLTVPERLVVARRVHAAGRGSTILSRLLSCSGDTARTLLNAASQDDMREVGRAG